MLFIKLTWSYLQILLFVQDPDQIRPNLWFVPFMGKCFLAIYGTADEYYSIILFANFDFWGHFGSEIGVAASQESRASKSHT